MIRSSHSFEVVYAAVSVRKNAVAVMPAAWPRSDATRSSAAHADSDIDEKFAGLDLFQHIHPTVCVLPANFTVWTRPLAVALTMLCKTTHDEKKRIQSRIMAARPPAGGAGAGPPAVLVATPPTECQDVSRD